VVCVRIFGSPLGALRQCPGGNGGGHRRERELEEEPHVECDVPIRGLCPRERFHGQLFAWQHENSNTINGLFISELSICEREKREGNESACRDI